MSAFITGFSQGNNRDIQFQRPYDKKGLIVFETEKKDTVIFEKINVRPGGNFTQQLQVLDHANKAIPVINADGGEFK